MPWIFPKRYPSRNLHLGLGEIRVLFVHKSFPLLSWSCTLILLLWQRYNHNKNVSIFRPPDLKHQSISKIGMMQNNLRTINKCKSPYFEFSFFKEYFFFHGNMSMNCLPALAWIRNNEHSTIIMLMFRDTNCPSFLIISKTRSIFGFS